MLILFLLLLLLLSSSNVLSVNIYVETDGLSINNGLSNENKTSLEKGFEILDKSLENDIVLKITPGVYKPPTINIRNKSMVALERNNNENGFIMFDYENENSLDSKMLFENIIELRISGITFKNMVSMKIPLVFTNISKVIFEGSVIYNGSTKADTLVLFNKIDELSLASSLFMKNDKRDFTITNTMFYLSNILSDDIVIDNSEGIYQQSNISKLSFENSGISFEGCKFFGNSKEILCKNDNEIKMSNSEVINLDIIDCQNGCNNSNFMNVGMNACERLENVLLFNITTNENTTSIEPMKNDIIFTEDMKDLIILLMPGLSILLILLVSTKILGNLDFDNIKACFFISLSIIDIMSDILFMLSLKDNIIKTVSVLSLGITIIGNLIISLILLKKVIKEEKSRDWIYNNMMKTVLILILCISGIDNLKYLSVNIGIVGFGNFDMYLSKENEMRIGAYGILSRIWEDIPHIILVLYILYGLNEYTMIGLISVIISIVTLIIIIIWKFIEFILSRAYMMERKSTDTENDYELTKVTNMNENDLEKVISLYMSGDFIKK